MKILIFMIFFLAWLLYHPSAYAGTTVVTVGGDSVCDYSGIQAAIDSGANEVRIASNAIYQENLLIDFTGIKLRGGFVDCNAANQNTPTTSRTTLSGDTGAARAVIEVKSLQGTTAVWLENLQLTDGSGTSSFSANGGLSITAASLNITLNNLLINNNSAGGGGGININGSQLVNMKIYDSIIENNTANNGGGIDCRGENSHIQIFGNSRIAYNTATYSDFSGGGFGGGVYLNQGCRLSIRAGEGLDGDAPNDIVSIHNNHAQTIGGGLFVFGSAHFSSEARGNLPVFLNENSADGHGGGIYVSGNDSLVQLIGTSLNQNSSGGNGGGVYIGPGAELLINRDLLGGRAVEVNNLGDSQRCLAQPRCNYFGSNLSQAEGGAIYNDDASVQLVLTYFEENRAQAAAAIANNNASTQIHGSVFAHNGAGGVGKYQDQDLFNFSNGGSFYMVYNTIVDNDVNGVLFNNTDGLEYQLSLYSTIVHQLTDVPILDFETEAEILMRCLLVHETASLVEFGAIIERVIQNTPDFINRSLRDYHLSSDSPAIDFCRVNNLSLYPDIDFQQRGIDDPLTPDFTGAYDLGVDEYVVIDLIFKDGFEPFICEACDVY